MKRKLTVQKRAQRWVSNYLPGDEHPYYAEAGYLAGFTAGQRDRQHKTAEVRRECFEHLARVTERQGRDVVRLASEVQRLRAKLEARTGSRT